MPIKKLEEDALATAKTLELTALSFQLPTAQQAAWAAFGACATAAVFAGWSLEEFQEWLRGSAEVSYKNSTLPTPMPSYEQAREFFRNGLQAVSGMEEAEPVVPCTVPDPVTLTCPYCKKQRVSLRHTAPPEADGSVQTTGECSGCGRKVDVKFSPIPKAKA